MADQNRLRWQTPPSVTPRAEDDIHPPVLAVRALRAATLVVGLLLGAAASVQASSLTLGPLLSPAVVRTPTTPQQAIDAALRPITGPGSSVGLDTDHLSANLSVALEARVQLPGDAVVVRHLSAVGPPADDLLLIGLPPGTSVDAVVGVLVANQQLPAVPSLRLARLLGKPVSIGGSLLVYRTPVGLFVLRGSTRLAREIIRRLP